MANSTSPAASNYRIAVNAISPDSLNPIARTSSTPPTLKTVTAKGRMGFGCLQLSYAPISRPDKIRIIQKAYSGGATLFDTAAAYGHDRDNEKLLGEALKDIDRAGVTIVTKCGIDFSTMTYALAPEQIRASVELSLKNLGASQLDLFYLHRLDPGASKEEFEQAVRTVKMLVKEGKVKQIGLSEPTADQIIEAHRLSPEDIPISSVESAYSIATRRAEQNGVLHTCRQLGIEFVAYTPVVRGLTDIRLQQISEDEIEASDPAVLRARVFAVLDIEDEVVRRSLGFYSVGFLDECNIKNNVRMILAFQKKAVSLNCSPTQLALAWLQHRGVTPIPATTNIVHLEENLGAQFLTLSEEALDEFDRAFPAGSFIGNPNPAVLDRFDNPALEQKRSDDHA